MEGLRRPRLDGSLLLRGTGRRRIGCAGDKFGTRPAGHLRDGGGRALCGGRPCCGGIRHDRPRLAHPQSQEQQRNEAPAERATVGWALGLRIWPTNPNLSRNCWRRCEKTRESRINFVIGL